MFGALLLLGLLYVFVIAPALNVASGAAWLTRNAGGWAVALLMLVQFAAQWGYYVLFEALWDGQTPGKRWLGLRVVQDGGYSTSFPASAARNIARALDLQPFFTYIVGLTAIAVSRTGKRAGDHLAGTIVVRERIVPIVPAARSDTEITRPKSSLTTALSDDELQLLERFLARVDALDPARRKQFATQLAARFQAHLPAAGQPLDNLRALVQHEQEARAHGAVARGEIGAAREQYALVAEGSERWSRFGAKLAEAQRRGLARMSGEEVAQFVAEYREIATDLARLATAARGRELDAIFRLSRLVGAGHNLLYRQERLGGQAIKRFLFAVVPAELRRSALPIAAAALLLFGSMGVTYISVTRNPDLVDELVGPGMIDRAEVDAARAKAGNATYIDVEDYARPIVASSVLRNNVQVAFFAFASGLTAGILTVLILIMNGVSIGAAFGLFAINGVGHLIADFVTAHSSFELTAICVAAGAGFLIAGAILLPGGRTRREALVMQGQRALRLLTASALFLVFAGAIEGLISPRTDLPYAFKAAVAFVSLLGIAVYTSLGRTATGVSEGPPAVKPREWG
jgi:uncharacterized membrane protein SpoIIM required for sporulation/uncharacterized RDD family membrane protein YckC